MTGSDGTAGARAGVDTVTVVGGGDAGLMTALILRELNPQIPITVVDDFDEQIPEVGKSTITYILNTFHDVLGIDRTRFVSEVKPVWKASVYFEDWCGREPFHVPFDDFTILPSDPGPRRFEELYHRYETGNFHTLGEELAEQRVTPVIELEADGGFTAYDHVAYHLSTNRLNEFLRELCVERGIDLVDDEITDVWTANGGIAGVASETAEYEADLYVDATGFERLLMGHLDNEFDRLEFPLDSALVAKADLPLSEVVPATVITSGDHGWFWQIDTFDWRDLGYVYSSAHASEDEALAEFVDERDEDISTADVRRYTFETGFYEAAWVGNCVAVGNALGFVEPLQSTALTLNAILAEKLGELLADHYRINHRGVRDIYNTYARNMWANVYDFISIHYRYAAGDTEFWRDARSVNDEDRLARYVGAYRDNGLTSHQEFGGRDGPSRRLFHQYIFYRVLRSLGVESAFYEDLDVDVSAEVERDIARVDERIVEDAKRHLSYEEVYRVFD